MGELTIFLSRMMAPYLLVTGLGFLISKKFYLRMLNEAESEHPISLNLSGMVHFFIGAAVLLTHFRWGNHLEIAISLIGLGFAVKGLTLIAIPDLAIKANKTTINKLPMISFAFISVGMYLALFGYLYSI